MVDWSWKFYACLFGKPREPPINNIECATSFCICHDIVVRKLSQMGNIFIVSSSSGSLCLTPQGREDGVVSDGTRSVKPLVTVHPLDRMTDPPKAAGVI